MKGPATVTITSTHERVTEYPTIFYRINGGPEVVSNENVTGGYNTCSFVVPGEGEIEIRYNSAVRWGMAGVPCISDDDHYMTVRIDGAGPKVTSDKQVDYANSATIKLTASDSASGLDKFETRLDDDTTATATGGAATISTNEMGAHSITYYAVDKAGNESQGTIDFAVKQPQSITISAPSAVAYSGKPKVTGAVTNGSGPAVGKTVTLQLFNGSSWTNVGTGTTGEGGAYAVTSSTGLTTARYLRVTCPGDATYAHVDSAQKLVKPMASLSNPAAPSTAYRYKAFSVTGYLKPRHTSGSYPVRIYKYRYEGGKWKSYGYVNAKASNYSSYSKYTGSVKLPYAGRWRLRAYHADSSHATTWSTSGTTKGYDYLTVK